MKVLIISTLLLFSSFLTDPSIAQQKEPPLKIGLTGKYPPFNYFDKSGNLSGFDVDVSKYICKNLNRKCEFIVLQWDGILAALQAKKIDLIIGSMAITPDREKQALFSIPYYESGAQIFARDPKIDPESHTFKIGVTLGTTYEVTIRERLPRAEVRTYKGDVEVLQDIEAGRLDAIVTDRLVGAYMIKNANVGLVPMGPPLFLERIGIPATKDSSPLIAKVNKAISSMRESSTYSALMNKYFGLQQQTTTAQDNLLLKSLPLLLNGLLWTAILSICGLSAGTLLSVVLSILIISAPAILKFLVRLYIDFFRSTPFLIQLLGIYFGLPAFGIALPPFQAAILCIALHSSAYLGEVFVAGFYAIPIEQRQAAKILGLSRWQTMRHIIFPQMLPIISAPSLNTIVAMIKDSSIVSVISVYELTMQAQQLISATYRPFELYFVTAILYAGITYPLILLGRRLDKPMQKRETAA